MKKRHLYLFCLFCQSAVSTAAPVSEQQAQRKAITYIAQHRSITKPTLDAAPRTLSRQSGTSTATNYYIFNIGREEGFIIVSGDDRTPAVLGCADRGHFDTDNIPANMQAWLDNCERQIAALRESQAELSLPLSTHQAIPAMTTSQWNQGEPFNSLCPVFFNGNRAVTGCVATAMAQILYFHRQEAVKALQTAILPYECITNWMGYGRLSVSGLPGGTPLEWEEMTDKYDARATESQKAAVATLMYACGAAVEMDYADQTYGSKASGRSIMTALKKYFGFDASGTLERKYQYTEEQWDSIIYSELSLGRPVILAGETAQREGHAFVVDGYDGDGRYHINWGWGGLSDGFYVLRDLTPDYQGIGGSSSGYNNEQTAVTRLFPGDGTPYEEKIRLTTSELTLLAPQVQQRRFSSLSVVMNYEYKLENHTANTRTFEFALGVFKGGVLQQVTARMSNAYTVTPSLLLSPKGSCYVGGNMTGTYRIMPISREYGTEEWLPNEDSEKWYIVMDINETTATFRLGVPYEEEEVTALHSPAADDAVNSSTYDLQGRKVDTFGSDKKSILIYNRKKFLNQR